MRNRMRTAGYLSALLVGGALLTASILGRAAEQKTLEGTISDAMCGMTHKSADAKACATACAKNGGYALVVGDKVYNLEGKEADVAKLAGEKAKVTGNVDGMKIQVSSVSAAEETSGDDMGMDHMM